MSASADSVIPSAAGVSPSGAKVIIEYPPVPTARYDMAALFGLITASCYVYYVMWPVVNTVWVDGYPQMGGAAPEPGAYQVTMYQWDWSMCIIMLAFGGIIIFYFMALVNNSIPELSWWHDSYASLIMFSTFVVFVILSWRWLFYCNTGYSQFDTSCNDYRWCGVFYPNVFCPNTGPFNPPVAFTQLSRNDEMTQHWAFTFAFFILAWWHVKWNVKLRSQGIFR
jgi:hypothetical protein